MNRVPDAFCSFASSLEPGDTVVLGGRLFRTVDKLEPLDDNEDGPQVRVHWATEEDRPFFVDSPSFSVVWVLTSTGLDKLAVAQAEEHERST